MLDIRSSNQALPASNDGLLIPKIDSFPSISPGLAQDAMLVYLTTAVGVNSPGFYYWDNPTTTWIAFGSSLSSNGWKLSGNSGTINGTHFIGTIDANDLDIRTNNAIRTRITTKGQIETLNTGRSVFLGNNAGENDDLNNRQNIFIGENAGFSNTTAGNNIALGYRSLSTNTLSSFNIAIGTDALRLNTAFFNTAIGFNALKSNTTGTENVSLGYQSLNNNTVGSRNMAIGSYSLANNTTGSDNTSMGDDAMRLNTSGTGNGAFGFKPLYSNTIGD
ncbi:MAG: hypothetical protein COW44_03815, partial [Flavobacteriaceae bacterium CG17_big_fil_post_rev_8_21_14_2_50_33_15]